MLSTPRGMQHCGICTRILAFLHVDQSGPDMNESFTEGKETNQVLSSFTKKPGLQQNLSVCSLCLLYLLPSAACLSLSEPQLPVCLSVSLGCLSVSQ